MRLAKTISMRVIIILHPNVVVAGSVEKLTIEQYKSRTLNIYDFSKCVHKRAKRLLTSEPIHFSPPYDSSEKCIVKLGNDLK